MNYEINSMFIISDESTPFVIETFPEVGSLWTLKEIMNTYDHLGGSTIVLYRDRIEIVVGINAYVFEMCKYLDEVYELIDLESTN